MASTSSTNGRVLKGGLACLYVVAFVIVGSHVTMQFAGTGSSRPQSFQSVDAKGVAVTRITSTVTSKVMTGTASSIESTAPVENQQSSILPIATGFFAVIVLSLVVGPMAAMSVCFLLAKFACGALALSGVLMAIATGGVIAAGGADKIRTRLEENDEGRWTEVVALRAAASRGNAVV